MDLQNPFQQLIFICGFLTLGYSIFSSYKMNDYSLEYLINSYFSGLSLAAGIGILIMIANIEGLNLPIEVSVEELKIFLPVVSIAIFYICFSRLFSKRKEKKEAT